MSNHKHSKIRYMQRNERGMASIVVVTILAVLITLISLGFARLMQRATINSENHQAASAATYAAESAINDVSTYIMNNPTVNSPQCNSLIGTSSHQGPFYNDAQLSNGAQYSCILLNQNPADVAYQDIPSNYSRVIKATTSAWTGSLDKMMISWQPSDGTLAGSQTATPLRDITTWNTAGSPNTCKNSAGVNSGCLPIMRVTLYPIPVGGDITNLQANTRTFFLYPNAGSATANLTSLNFSTVADGTVQPVNCRTTKIPNINYFNGTADYTCNIIFTNLTAGNPSPTQTDYYYVRLMPLYSAADVKIKANDKWNQVVKFVHVQAIADVTATSDSVSKRLQARVDISSVGNNGQPGDNLSPTDFVAPEYGIRTAQALCKRWMLYKPPVSYYSFVQLDPNSPAQICNPGGNTVFTPTPTLAMVITGNDSPDNGLTVCSTDNDSNEIAKWGCNIPPNTAANSSNNPDSGQIPVNKSTVYITNKATVSWQTTDAGINCVTSVPTSNDGSGVNKWASANKYGDPNAHSTWSGSTETGYQAFTNITTVTKYTMVCRGAGGSTAPKTVIAWPPPKASVSVSPSTVYAGQDYTVNWSSANARPNGSNPCTLSGEWSGQVNSSGSRDYHWDWNDTSTKTYKVTCYDPIGRSQTASLSIKAQPPQCSASISPYPANYSNFDHGDGTGGWQWNGSCTGVPSSSTWAAVTCNGPGIQCSNTLSGNQTGLGSGSYSASIQVGPSGSYWPGDTASDSKSWTIHHPITGMSLSGQLWNQDQRCSSPGNWWDTTWWCRGGDGSHTITYPNGGGVCADGAHEWTLCYVSWSSSNSGDGSITCSISESYGSLIGSLPNSGTQYGPPNPVHDQYGNTVGYVNDWGWGDSSSNGGYGHTPNGFTLKCWTPWGPNNSSSPKQYYCPDIDQPGKCYYLN